MYFSLIFTSERSCFSLASWETKIFIYCVKSHSNNWKAQSKNLLQTILTKYYRTPPSKQYLITVITVLQRFLTNYYQINHCKQFLQTLFSATIWEFIPSNSYKKFYLRTLGTKLTNLLSKNYFKQYISTKSFQTTYYKLLPQKSLQTVLTNYYKKMILKHIYVTKHTPQDFWNIFGLFLTLNVWNG